MKSSMCFCRLLTGITGRWRQMVATEYLTTGRRGFGRCATAHSSPSIHSTATICCCPITAQYPLPASTSPGAGPIRRPARRRSLCWACASWPTLQNRLTAQNRRWYPTVLSSFTTRDTCRSKRTHSYLSALLWSVSSLNFKHDFIVVYPVRENCVKKSFFHSHNHFVKPYFLSIIFDVVKEFATVNS